MRIGIPSFALTLALAACSDPAPDLPRPDNRIDADAPTVSGPPTPTPSPTAGYIGRWAEAPGQCGSASWLILELDLTSPRGIACDFGGVRAVDGGHEADAVCTGESLKRSERVNLRATANGLEVRSPSLGRVDLVRCGAAEAP